MFPKIGLNEKNELFIETRPNKNTEQCKRHKNIGIVIIKCSHIFHQVDVTIFLRSEPIKKHWKMTFCSSMQLRNNI